MLKSYFNWNSTPGEKYRVILFGNTNLWFVLSDRHQVQMSYDIEQVVRGGMRQMLWRESFPAKKMWTHNEHSKWMDASWKCWIIMKMLWFCLSKWNLTPFALKLMRHLRWNSYHRNRPRVVVISYEHKYIKQIKGLCHFKSISHERRKMKGKIAKKTARINGKRRRKKIVALDFDEKKK